MARENSIFTRMFNNIANRFKRDPWYLPFSQTLQDFAVRFVPQDKEDKKIFSKTKSQLLRVYKAELAKKLDVEPDTFAQFLKEAIYADPIILPNLVKIGDEALLSELFYDLADNSMLIDINKDIVSKSICPIEIIKSALSSEQPAELRKIALLKPGLSYVEKVIACEDVLYGDENVELKDYFSKHLQPTAHDIPSLLEYLADNALNKKDITSLSLQYGSYILNFTGYTFANGKKATADIVLNDTVLFREDVRKAASGDEETVQFGTFSDKESATSFLKKKFGSLPFVVNNFQVLASEGVLDADESSQNVAG